MTERSENTVRVSHEQALAAANAWATPENLAWFDALTDEDIAAQIASNPDAAPELTDEWFENARLVIPLKGRKRAA
ncbi:MAG: hypothetical protein M3R64_08680 [Pseudomonadota bacterium]|nr:hypothetical protein [Pseudomonadota bacterium]